jgi:hypothetical protein
MYLISQTGVDDNTRDSSKNHTERLFTIISIQATSVIYDGTRARWRHSFWGRYNWIVTSRTPTKPSNLIKVESSVDSSLFWEDYFYIQNNVTNLVLNFVSVVKRAINYYRSFTCDVWTVGDVWKLKVIAILIIVETNN